MTDSRTEVRHPHRIVALWTGFLLAPVAVLANLELAYLMVHTSCVHANSLPVHLVHASFLLITLAGLFVAWRMWKTEGGLWPADEGGPMASARFLAGVGVVGSALSGMVIIAQWIPTFALQPCQ